MTAVEDAGHAHKEVCHFRSICWSAQMSYHHDCIP